MSTAQNKKLTANIKAHGCAAKLSPLELAQIVKSLPEFSSENLICGTKNFEDAAVYKLTDELALVSTIDFFPPLIDDPFLYGRIAAVNALSDIYAMGGTPIIALNVFCFPTCDFPLSIAEEIIAGGAQAVKDASCLLAGGHSIQAPEPIYGLAVNGLVNPSKLLTNDGAKEGDVLLLCKALGTGVGLLAHKGAQLSSAAYEELVASLTRLNGPCMAMAASFDVHAATDITGFGLVGHLHEMSKASGFAARIDSKEIPLLPEVLHCAEQGLVPAAAYANRKSYGEICNINDAVELAITDLVFDPQTSGGLLFAMPEKDAGLLCRQLIEAGWPASIIGSLNNGTAGNVEVI